MTAYAVVLMDNPVLGRKAARAIDCGGIPARTVGTVDQMSETVDQEGDVPAFVCLPLEQLEAGLRVFARYPQVRIFPFAQEADPNIFAQIVRCPSVTGLLGLPEPGGHPRAWELLTLARRLSRSAVPPMNAPLTWGHEWVEQALTSSNEREAVVERVQSFCTRLQGNRGTTAIIQLVDELIMNAIYDAPVDARLRPLFAHRRQEPVKLEPSQRPVFGFGCDGSRVVISIANPFGGLRRDSVFAAIHRGLTTGHLSTSGGGAGLGMLLLYQAAKVVFFDVVPGRLTQVTTVTELDIPPNQTRKVPGSVHYFLHPADATFGRAARAREPQALAADLLDGTRK